MGEVHTNEEAQVYDHDLDLFVTVQLVENTRLQFYHLENSAKNTGILVSGPMVKNHSWPNKGRIFFAKRTISYLLLFQSCHPVLVPVRPQHWHRRTCLHRVQPQSDVTIRLQKTGARQTQSPKTKIKRGMTIEIRTTVCEIFLMVGEVLRRSRGHRSACTRTHFSWLRLGTAYKSGIKDA